MATLKKYNLKGKEVGDVTIDDAIATAEANSQMIKDYIVAIRNNARQWSASTQGRSEVNHSNKKPHPQKGTGRARQGRLSSPQYKGGGVVFGPKPKFDQHVGINRKERRAAILALIAEKIRDNRLKVLDSVAMDAPKTKAVAEFIQTCGLEGRILFLSEGNYQEVETEGKKQTVSVKSEGHRNFAKSIGNLGKVQHGLVKNASGYDLLIAKEVVMTEAALQELAQWLPQADNQQAEK